MTRRGAGHDDAVARLRATVAGGVLGIVFAGLGTGAGYLAGVRGLMLVPVAILSGIAAAVVVRQVALTVAGGMSRALGAFLYPTGASVPYEQTFSSHDAKEAAGDIAGAIAAYEATIVANPTNARALRQAAELHARAGNPGRAVELLLQLRRLDAGRDVELFATQRLVDLFLGALDDEGRAFVELRRLSERFPGTPEGEGALAALRRFKNPRDAEPPT